MIYEENKTRWAVGDLVIHGCDAKKEEMLMRVIGYDKKSGLCKTQYATAPNQINNSRKKDIWMNEVRYLHDPSRFGLVNKYAS
jgi:hypothetical protein